MRLKFFALIGLFGFLGLFCQAAPVPSSISYSGNFSGYPTNTNAKKVTIVLSGGGTKTTAAPAVWAPFEDVAGSSLPSTLGYQNKWAVTENGSTTTAAAFGGTYSFGSTNLSSVSSTIFRVRVDTTTDAVGRGGWMFAAFKRKSLYTYVDLNMKWIRFWDANGGGGGGSQYPNMYWSTQGATRTSRLMSLEIVPDTSKTKQIAGTYPHPGQTASHAWRTELYKVQVNSAINANDGQALSYVFLPSSGSFFASSTTWATDSTNAPGIFDQISIQTDVSSGLADGEEFFDDVYADYSPACVFLSDASTFVGANVNNQIVDMQIPSTWSDTSITAYINTSGFSDGAQAYLYVCDSNNSCNSAGFPVTVGASQTVVATNPSTLIKGISAKGVNFK